MNVELVLLDEAHLDALFAVKNSAEVLATIPGDFPLDSVSFRVRHQAEIDAGPSLDTASYVIRVDGVVAGSIGHFHRVGQGCEVGYYVARRWWGQGVATRALRAYLDVLRALGFSGPVNACHAVGNDASGRVLAKAGFRQGGTVPFTMPNGTVELDVAWVLSL